MADRPERPLVSIVVPVLDEKDVIEALHARLDALARRADLGASLEIVFVDDGSTDGSAEVLARLAGSDPRVRVLGLSRNFGQEAACAAGLDHAQGDAVIVMDADLQDPPELVVELVQKWRQGYDVVHARRRSRRGDPALKRIAAFCFYRFMGLASDARMVPDAGAYRLLDRSVVDALSGSRDRGRFLRGLACWVGGRQAQVRFDRDRRHAGRTKYGPARQASLALDAVTSFSALPVRLVGLAGALLSLAGTAGAGVVAGLALAGRIKEPAAWAAVCACSLGAGLVMSGLWVVGEYVIALGREVRGLPLYVVNRKLGLAEPRRAGDP